MTKNNAWWVNRAAEISLKRLLELGLATSHPARQRPWELPGLAARPEVINASRQPPAPLELRTALRVIDTRVNSYIARERLGNAA
ncbi:MULTISPECIES: hypothetical protein [unclassified Cryobacterium]|uniref:hypothetical protein n=1 Tax=unclassified Cryobacterium TaxID=2649013 RepID=UPI002AB40A88|nr:MULTISPECIES: hypothetical protein [Cryobacterium]MDY7526371.1 hypothetical protein [Cryobacterium sp. 10C2]MDY7557825.1 hypothetical protein [Cryobacterium sp. 10C3]MEB0004199.1 hypothetical protein [Cryobacterium sp. RTC2.1]MEB0203353.1 hypothetical protein [Cryobacterium sp. 5I3]MEB0287890.1 hypothetical protein [Cryobacterium sp. 10S3]